MSLNHGSLPIVTDKLDQCLDATNPRSFPSDGIHWVNLAVDKPNLNVTIDGFDLNNGWAVLYNGASAGGATTTDDGGAIIFDGTDDVAYTYISFTDTLSVSCWINFTGVTNNAFFGTVVSPVVNFGTWGGVLYSALRGTAYNVHTPQTNRWYNYVATFDTSYQKTYIDGQLFGSHSTSNSNSISKTDISLTIGYLVYGKISQALVYDQALTAEEVSQNYNATKWRYI